MAAINGNGTSGWARWLHAQLDKKRLTPAALIRASGGALSSPRLTNWLSGKETPRLSSIRIVCATLNVPAVEGMIAAGHLRPEDVGATVVHPPEPRPITKREVLDWIARNAPDEDTPDDTASGERPTARPYVVRPRGQEGQDWAARRRQD